MVRWTLTSLNLFLQKVYSNFMSKRKRLTNAHNISKNNMFQGSFSTSPCGSQSALLRYIDTFCKGNLYWWGFIEYVFPRTLNLHLFHRKRNEAFEESEVSTFFIRRLHSFGITCLHQSSNPKLVGQAAVLKNRELDSVGSKHSWQLSSWVTQDLANNTVPLYLWVVPPKMFTLLGNPKSNLDLPRASILGPVGADPTYTLCSFGLITWDWSLNVAE